MNRNLQVLTRLSLRVLTAAAVLLGLYQAARAQCPQVLSDIQWATPDPANPLTVSKLLNAGTLDCKTPIYFGLHRGGYTRAMDLDPNNQPILPNLAAGQASGQGLAGTTVAIGAGGKLLPVFPQSLASVAIPAYQSYLASNGFLPPNIDPNHTLQFRNAHYSAWPAIVELDPRQDATGTWYLFHGLYTNSDALTPGVDPNDPNQASVPTAQATLANDQALYRAAPLRGGTVGSSSAPVINQIATAQNILDSIMTDSSVNMLLQLHTRSYTDTLNFYDWLIRSWAPGHTDQQIINVATRIFFVVDLNKLTPPGQGSSSNDYNNLNYLASWSDSVYQILRNAQVDGPPLPFSAFAPLPILVNFYDDTNLNTQADVDNAFAILESTRSIPYVKYLGLEITDENSQINPQLERLGQMAKSQLGMQIGKSVLTGDHFLSVTDSNGNAAIRYGSISAGSPTTLVTGNNSIVNGTTFQQLWANNQANLVDLNYSLSFQLGVQDVTPGSPMNVYDPADNAGALTQVQPTIVLTDLPLIHGAKQNGEVRTVFQGSYVTPKCAAGYPGCNDANTPNQTVYTFCASEGGICGNLTGDRNLAYGANGKYLFTTVTNGPLVCTLSNFGTTDPAPGVAKACYYSPPIGYYSANLLPPGVIYCADEGQYCDFTGTGTGVIAVHGQYIVSPFYGHFSNGFQCDQSTFGGGNFFPGSAKACFYNVQPGYLNPPRFPPGYQFCSGENGAEGGCHFKGPGRVAYGSYDGNGQFTYRVFNGGVVPCNNDVFGDPNPSTTKNCFYQVTNAVSGATGTSAGGGGTGTALTCDLYATGGTPCVAAHSTVRALFGGYSGRLYQVKRASDGATTDIGTLATGGYANAAAQDSFCAGTACTITIIYDQSSRHNDLPIEGDGDFGASANALPISVNGHGVYGIKITPGAGYRNNSTSGVAKGASPEGIYMVTSGTYVNSGCCFDYGNVEATIADTGNGHMDALNFGTACVFGPCTGSGPWVEADLENGQFMGNGSNPKNQPLTSNFVTAMSKNNGTTTFALKGGNAQSGGLTTEYSGTLPTFKPGYTPMMSMEGSIVLGTGGDNSKWSLGAFFEGAMTSGYPTDATEDAVQANIVAAGYSGDSSGGTTNGGIDANEPPGPYTGPNDPDGPGAQDGIGQPAAEQPNDQMSTKPALASFNGSLYVAFQGVNAANDFYVTSSSSGNNFPAATRYTNLQMSSAPALAAFNGKLYAAFRGLNAANDFYVTSSSDGANFPTATRYTNIQMGGAPALAVFNSQLCAAFQAVDPGHTLHVTCSSDGVTWPTAWQVGNVAIGSDPAMTVFNGKLYVAFRGDDPGNAVWLASSSDGHTFSSQSLPDQHMGGSSSPALVASNGVLYYIYGANDSDNEMLVSSSTDGFIWHGPAAYLNNKMSPLGPGAAAFGDGISIGFQSNDSRNVLFVTGKQTQATSYSGPNDPGGAGPQDGFGEPAAEQPNDQMATKPALAAFNGSLYVAFQGLNAGNDLYITSSSSGNNFPAATRYTNIYMGSAPAMAAFNNQLYVAFQADDPNHEFFVTSSSTGSNFPAATIHSNIQMGGAPALAVFNNQLCAAFQANDPGHTLHLTCSSDGVTWPSAWQVANVAIGSDPAMAVFNGKLYVAFRGDDSGNAVWLASSSDGHTFSSQSLPGQHMGGSSSPALVASNGALYYIYGANDGNNEMLVSASTDGTNWQGPAAYLGLQMGATGPGAAKFGNQVVVGFQSNDSRHVLFVTSKGIANPSIPGYTGIINADPSVIRVGSTYISVETWNNETAIAMRQASSPAGLGSATPKVIVQFQGVKSLWAPEIQYINGTFCIYYSADFGLGRKMYFIIFDPNFNEISANVLNLPNQNQALDGNFFLYKGQGYFVWSDVESDDPNEQNLYLIKMSDPVTATGPSYRISQPHETWERVTGGPPNNWINEAPAPIIDPAGQLHIFYSANGSWTDQYCIADLRLVSGGDPTNVWDWHKSNGCEFGSHAETMMRGWDPTLYVDGPGSHSFVLENGDINTSPPAGTVFPLYYHAVPKGTPYSWANREWFNGGFQWYAGAVYTRCCVPGTTSDSGWGLKFYEDPNF